MKISEIKSFHFGYSVNMMMNGNVIYDVILEDGKYKATIKPYMVSSEDALVIDLTDEQVEKLKNILIDKKVSKWNGFNKSDKNVLDGNSFSFSVYFVNGEDISAHGYMVWPSNYGEVRGALDEFFGEIYKSFRPDDIEE